MPHPTNNTHHLQQQQLMQNQQSQFQTAGAAANVPINTDNTYNVPNQYEPSQFEFTKPTTATANKDTSSTTVPSATNATAINALSLPGGYVPLEDLWNKHYFSMVITLKDAEEELRRKKKE